MQEGPARRPYESSRSGGAQPGEPTGVRTGGLLDPREIGGAWWVVALVGLLSLVAGIIVLAQPSISLATLAVIAGIFLLVDGIFEVGTAIFDAPEHRALLATFGVVTTIVGVILIRHPTHAVVAIALLLGLWLLIVGLIRLIRSIGDPGRSVWSVVLAVLEIIAGIVIVASPGIGVATLALLVGISWIVRGIAAMFLGWTLRGLRRHGGAVHHAAPASP